MIDTDRLRPRISPLDIWRIGASLLFVAFGGYFIVTFIIHRLGHHPRAWTQLMLGGLILLYGIYRLVSGWRNYRRMREDAEESKVQITEAPKD